MDLHQVLHRCEEVAQQGVEGDEGAQGHGAVIDIDTTYPQQDKNCSSDTVDDGLFAQGEHGPMALRWTKARNSCPVFSLTFDSERKDFTVSMPSMVSFR